MSYTINDLRFFTENDIDPGEFVEFYKQFHKSFLSNFYNGSKPSFNVLMAEIMAIRNTITESSSKTLDLLSQSSQQLENLNKSSHQSICNYIDDLSKFLETNRGAMSSEIQQCLMSYLKNIDNVFTNTVESWNNHQKTINELVMEKIENRINKAVSSAVLSDKNINSIFDKTSDIDRNLKSLNDRFNNSSKKGELSQNLFIELLATNFPTAEIIDKSKEPRSGDIHFSIDDHPPIMLEIKNYTRNVDKKEIIKFQDDAANTGLHSILISLKSGIAKKKDFSFEILNNRILFFIHNTGFSSEKLELAFNTIYMLDSFLLSDDPKTEISDNDIRSLNIMYNNIVSSLKDMESNMKSALDSLKKINLTVLESLLSNLKKPVTTLDANTVDPNTPMVLGNTVNHSFHCDQCERFFTSSRGLKQHFFQSHRQDI